MKAVICKSLEGPDALMIEDVPQPIAKAGEVVIRVSAVALNFFDLLLTQGKYQYKPDLPFSPGGEIAGHIVSIGDGVEDLKKGQRVFAYNRLNGCREELAVAARDVIPLPDELSDDLACTLPIAYGTAYHALEDRGRLQQDETLLVLGATGGAGLAAVEIGKLKSARVIAAGTSKEKLEMCLEHGAQKTLDLTTGNLKEAIRSLTDGKGPDVIYDCIGGPYAEPALRSIGWGGRYLVVGFAAGGIPKIPLNLLLLKGCEMIGVFWGRHTEQEPKASRHALIQLADWCAKGRIKPHIDRIFPLEHTAEALRLIQNRDVKGKIVIKP